MEEIIIPEKICSHCSTPIEVNQKFCTGCGYPEEGTEKEKAVYHADMVLAHSKSKDAPKLIRQARNTLFFIAGITLLFGIYAFNALVQNYAEGPLKIWFIPVLILGAVGAFWPLNLMANIGGAILVIGVIMMSKRHSSEDTQGETIAQS